MSTVKRLRRFFGKNPSSLLPIDEKWLESDSDSDDELILPGSSSSSIAAAPGPSSSPALSSPSVPLDSLSSPSASSSSLPEAKAELMQELEEVKIDLEEKWDKEITEATQRWINWRKDHNQPPDEQDIQAKRHAIEEDLKDEYEQRMKGMEEKWAKQLEELAQKIPKSREAPLDPRYEVFRRRHDRGYDTDALERRFDRLLSSHEELKNKPVQAARNTALGFLPVETAEERSTLR